MSPERLECKKYSHNSDIWSLGLIIMELATGKYPYKIDNKLFEFVLTILNNPDPSLPPDSKYS